MLVERERQADGGLAQVLAVFLTGRECPFTCVFCDLWRFTTDDATPPGAIPAQLAAALAGHQADLEPEAQIKLYNASNFFDPGSVPTVDDREILRQVDRFAKVIVECHPRLVGRRYLSYADRLAGRLQVAMGLETIHPEALPRLGKQATLDDFRRAAETLREHGVSWRAFVLVGAPFVPPSEAVDWAERSARFAFEHGAEHVALIPVRGGNGEMERLLAAGSFTPPSLSQVERAFERCLRLDAGVVTVDTWDLDRLATCPTCRPARIARIARINLSGSNEPDVDCLACDRRSPDG